MKPRLYIETTVISYLSSRPARDLRSAARQEWTHDFWKWATESADIFTSELTRIEAGRGDTEPEDALHFAIATLAKMDFVASWNFSHLVGEQPKRQLGQVLQQLGYAVPMLATPESLLESLK